MGTNYVVKDLAPKQILQALPLARLVDANLSEEQWIDYAETLTDQATNGHCGIMTVQSKTGTIYGLSAYRLKNDLRSGRVLEIENFAAMDLRGGRSAAAALLRALERLARKHDCSCVSINLMDPYMRLWLREPSHPGVDMFRSRGYRGEPLRLRKCFAFGEEQAAQ